MEIEILQSEMGTYHKCESIFARLYVDPITLSQPLNIKPVFAGTVDAPVMLIGQAPGIKLLNMKAAGHFKAKWAVALERYLVKSESEELLLTSLYIKLRSRSAFPEERRSENRSYSLEH